MFSTDDPSAYLARAEMHEQLAAATDDIPARKMHLAMAAEYRRKAGDAGTATIRTAAPPSDRLLKMGAAIR
jgi:hypothetical protein